MIKLEDKQYKTLILKIPKQDILFSKLTLAPHSSKIEVIHSKENTYIYIAIKQSMPSAGYNLLEKELKINLKDAVLLSRGSWIKAVNTTYYSDYEAQGPENTYLTGGNKSIYSSASSLVKEKRLCEGTLIKEIIDIFTSDDTMKGERAKDKESIIKPLLPAYAYRNLSNIIHQVNLALAIRKAATLPEAEMRMCMVINGESESGKTPLAGLILKKLAEKKVIHFENTKLWKAQPLNGTLRKGTINGYQGIIGEEFNGSHFSLDVFCRLSDPDHDKIKVMYGDEPTDTLRATIFTTINNIFEGITPDMNSMSLLGQLAKRTYYTFQVVGNSSYFGKNIKDKSDYHWKYSQDRIYLYGNVQQDILRLLMDDLLPHMLNETLIYYGNRSKLGNLLIKLHKEIFKIMLKECQTIYLEDHQIPPQYQTYESLQCFPKKTVKVFQYDKQGLKVKIKEIAGAEGGFIKNNPPTYNPFQAFKQDMEINPHQDYLKFYDYLQKTDEFYLDTETGNFKDKNPMSNLGLRTIQIDTHYLIGEDLEQQKKDDLIKIFVNKTVYLFNLNFDASQLKHAGFNVEANKGYDIALLARVCENSLMDKFTFSLNNLALNFVGYSEKSELVDKLMKKFKVKSRDALFSCKGLIYDPDFKEYALNDIFLTDRLHHFLKHHYNHGYWFNILSPLHYQQGVNGFQGVKVDLKDINNRILDLTKLKRKVLEKLPDLTKGNKSVSDSRGWNSPKLVDKGLRETFSPENLKELVITNKGIYSFDKNARQTLRYKFPDNNILKSLGCLAKKNKTLGDLKNMRKMAEGCVLRYGYQTAGTATGRFTTSKPAFHNFAKRAPNPGILSLKEEINASSYELEHRYSMRKLLLNKPGVFSLDFKNQENRMTAYLVNDIKAQEIFIRGGDQHGEEANKLNISRDTAKIAVHGLTYDMKGKGLAKRLTNEGFPTTELEGIRLQKEFEASHPELMQFKRKIRGAIEYESLLFKRKVKLKDKDKMNGIVQGNCSELIIKALTHLYTYCLDRVKVLPHFHDELVLECLKCKVHNKEPCQPILNIKKELEALYPFVWPQTDIRVFELGVK